MNRVRDNILNTERNPDNFQENNDEGVVIPHLDVDMTDHEEIDIDDNIITLNRLKSSMSDKALNTLNDLRCNNLLCDAVISVSDACFNVHRAILSSCSSYFR